METINKIQSACDPTPKSCLHGGDERPTLYLRLAYDKQYGELITRFCERDTIRDKKPSKEINPDKYANKHCVVIAAVKIESIFVSDNATLQVRAHKVALSEAERKPRDEESWDDL